MQVFATGIKVWPPCPIMCHLLIDQAAGLHVPGATILELGAGVGMLGVVGVALGARNVAITEINDLCRVAIAVNVMINGDAVPGLQAHRARSRVGVGSG
jgi:predicted RNA methylase